MLTAVVGLEDAIVVVTDDVALVMHRDHAQDVKAVVERLKASGGTRRWRITALTVPGVSTRA